MRTLYTLIFSSFIFFSSSAQYSLLKDLEETNSIESIGVANDRYYFKTERAGMIRVASIKSNGEYEELDSIIFNTGSSYNLSPVLPLFNNKQLIIIGQNRDNHLIITDGTSAGTEVMKFDNVNGYFSTGKEVYLSNYDKVLKVDLESKTITDLELPYKNFSAFGKINDSICLFSATIGEIYLYRYNILNKKVTPVKVIPSVGSVKPSSLVSIGNKVVFIARNGDVSEYLYISDGTSTGTVKVKEFEVTLNQEFPHYLWNNKLFFKAWVNTNTQTTRKTLYSTDGTNVNELGPYNFGEPVAAPYNFTPFNGKLYYITYDGFTNLISTDGTPGGTAIINISYAGSPIRPRGNMVTDLDNIYFGGEDVNDKYGIFSFNKNGVLKNHFLTSNLYINDVVMISNRIVFKGSNDKNGNAVFIMGDPDPTAIKENINSKESLILSPNPAKNHIKVTNTFDISRIEISNYSGLVKQADNTDIINTENLSKGLYFITVTDKKGNSYIQKVILE